MSAITLEEIERIIDEECGVPHGAFLRSAERVAALVEKRLREKVCKLCGGRGCPMEGWECGEETITRAQWEADREAREYEARMEQEEYERQRYEEALREQDEQPPEPEPVA